VYLRRGKGRPDAAAASLVMIDDWAAALMEVLLMFHRSIKQQLKTGQAPLTRACESQRVCARSET
jgi:hypothetical protein